MEVVGDGVFQVVFHRQLIEEVEAFLVDLQQHLKVCLWHMVDIHLITSLHQLFGLQATEIRQIIRGIDEILVEVVDDIDTLVGATGKSLCRIHQQFYLAVILLADMVYLIGMKEEVILFIAHKQTQLVETRKNTIFVAKVKILGTNIQLVETRKNTILVALMPGSL